MEVLGKLKPAFVKDGTVTAGNSSQLSDGAACCVVMDRKKAESMGIKDMWRIVSFGTAGVHPEYMGMGPEPATRKVLARAKMKLDDMDAIELNEAFAAQSLAVIRNLEANPEKVNQHGGAVALGHPLGCSGARIVVTLIGVLNRIGGKRGLATMCVGGGMGGALIIEKV
jgi:acetyl-CoA acetyltransferase family protein